MFYFSHWARHRYAKRILKAKLQSTMTVMMSKIKEGIIYQSALLFTNPIITSEVAGPFS